VTPPQLLGAKLAVQLLLRRLEPVLLPGEYLTLMEEQHRGAGQSSAQSAPRHPSPTGTSLPSVPNQPPLPRGQSSRRTGDRHGQQRSKDRTRAVHVRRDVAGRLLSATSWVEKPNVPRCVRLRRDIAEERT
jgi:hypothetical protein